MAFCKSCNKEIEDGKEYCDECKVKEEYLDNLLDQFSPKTEEEQSAVRQLAREPEVAEEVFEDFPKFEEETLDEEVTIDIPVPDAEFFEDAADGSEVLMFDEEEPAADVFADTFFEEDMSLEDTFSLEDAVSAEDEVVLEDAVPTGDDASLEDMVSPDESTTLEDDEISNLLGDIFGDEAPEDVQESEYETESEPKDEGDDELPDFLADLDALLEQESHEVQTGNFGDMLADDDVVEEDTDEPVEDFFADSFEELSEDNLVELQELEETTEDDIPEDLMQSLFFDGEPEELQESTPEEVPVPEEDSDDDILSFLQTLGETEELADYTPTVANEEYFAESDETASATDEVAENRGPDSSESGEKKGNKVKEFFSKLFGNVEVERTPEEIEKLKQEALQKYEADEVKKQNEKELAAKRKEEKQKQKEADAAAKKEQEAAKAKAALEKKKQKEEQKKLAKDKKALEKKRILDEIDDYEGSINKVGASIIFLLFGTLLIFIIAGTNIYTYNVAIKTAQKEFENKEYNDAYEQVAGIDILEEDILLYERIMTVMYVNKQLNSYYNYMVIDSPELALDSLLKGLMRYDKYIAYAQQLEITNHLDYVKSLLLQELKLEFELTEEQAYDIIKSESQEEYSDKILELIAENK